MTEERSTLRYSLIPSLYNVYEYNSARGNSDIKIFEIGKSYYKKEDIYSEDEHIGILMSGNYYEVLGNTKEVNFYTIKGIMERLLDFLGYKGRYYLLKNDIPNELHPGQSATIYIDNKKIGIIGKLHPSINKNNIFVLELNLSMLKNTRVSKMKFKEINKYPGISKDMAFILDDKITSEEVIKTIKKAGGKLVTNIKVFDLYKGNNLEKGKKSLAFNIYFEDVDKTLTLEEITPIFEKIISEVEKKHNAILRNS